MIKNFQFRDGVITISLRHAPSSFSCRWSASEAASMIKMIENFSVAQPNFLEGFDLRRCFFEKRTGAFSGGETAAQWRTDLFFGGLRNFVQNLPTVALPTTLLPCERVIQEIFKTVQKCTNFSFQLAFEASIIFCTE
jgi:hypothetical protein